MTKTEIEERRLNIFNYTYVIDIVDPTNLNDDGIYRFGIIKSHGDVYLLIKSNNEINILSDLDKDGITRLANQFLTDNYKELGEEMAHKYRNAVEDWFKNRTY